MNNRDKALKFILLVLLGFLSIAAAGQAFAQGGTWETKASMPTARHLAGAQVNGVVYAIGGFNDSSGFSVLATVEAYDPATNTWSTKAAMPTARYVLAAAAVNGIVYAVGGNNGGAVLATMQAYNTVTNTWSSKAAMPTARSELAAVEVNGLVYAVGGKTQSGSFLATVEAYDPVANTWSSKAAMPTARYGLAGGEVDGIVYAVGGQNASTILATVEAYDPATNTWSSKAAMPTARFGLAGGEVNGIVYAVGGHNGNVLATNEAFNPDQPPVALCKNVTVNTSAGVCSAPASVDNGSFDPDGTISTLVQSPPGPYGKGTITVTLLVTDDQGASNSCTGTVTVVDNQPPALTCPVPQIIDATGPSGANAIFSPTVSDNCSGAIAVSCTPASSSTFPIGSTAVSCSATDASSNQSSCDFTVSVTAAAGQISNLINTVQTFNLKQGIANSLDSKLQNIQTALNAAQGGSVGSTCNKINAFINETQAQSGKALTVDQANQLITSANRIKAVIGCL